MSCLVMEYSAVVGRAHDTDGSRVGEEPWTTQKMITMIVKSMIVNHKQMNLVRCGVQERKTLPPDVCFWRRVFTYEHPERLMCRKPFPTQPWFPNRLVAG